MAAARPSGSYQKYELEHAALVFLVGDNKCPGRLSAIIEDCVFRNGVGDGVHASVNTKLTMKNCLAENVFRGGFTLTGGHSVATVKNLTTRGRIDPTGIDVEVDSEGYGNSYKVEVYLENLNIEDGDFDVGVRDGSLFISALIGYICQQRREELRHPSNHSRINLLSPKTMPNTVHVKARLANGVSLFSFLFLLTKKTRKATLAKTIMDTAM